MAWLETYGSTNKILDEKTTRTQTVTVIAGTVSSWSRQIEELHYRYVAMSESAADTCLAVMQGAGFQAAMKRENVAGAYTVEVKEITYGAWS